MPLIKAPEAAAAVAAEPGCLISIIKAGGSGGIKTALPLSPSNLDRLYKKGGWEDTPCGVRKGGMGKSDPRRERERVVV